MDPMLLLSVALGAADFLIKKAQNKETVSKEEWDALWETKDFDTLVPKRED